MKQEDDALLYWRGRIVLSTLACGFLLSTMAFPAAIVLIVKERLWLLAVIDASALSGVAYLLFSRKLGYRFRAGGTLLLIYVVGLGVLMNAGILSGAPAWLFVFSVFAGLLLGLKAACVAISINLVTLSVFWYLISHGVFWAQFQFFSSTERAFVALVSFIMLNIAAAVSAAVMLKGLERATHRQKDVAELLKREIEEHERSEQALKESESRLKSTFRATPVGLAIVKERKFIAVNESYCRIVGYGEADLLGKSPRILYEDENENVRIGAKLYTRLLDQGVAYAETRHVRKDGEVRDVVLRAAHLSPLDPPAGSVVAIEDVTEKKRSDKSLRESEEKFRKTFQGSPDSITITRMRDGQYIEVNEGFTKMTGYTRKEAIGKTPRDLNLIVNHQDRETFVRKLRLTGEIDGFEVQYRNKNGTIMDTLLAARPLVYVNEDCLVAVVKDISQMKRTVKEKAKLEKQLLHAQKMESMGTLAGGIAHDFNNLLMGIQGRISLILMGKDPSYPDFDHLKEIEEYIRNAATLTRQLLGFARGGKYEVKSSDINDLVRKSAEMFGRTRKEIEIRSKYHKDIWTVDVDRGQIDQVLMNVFVNAWQAMPGGGTLFLETANAVLDEEYLKPFSVAPGKFVKISVTDTGIGMDKSTQKRIFDPFFTTKEMGKGTGLGLASAYGIIKNHGGFINVYSEMGQGTNFNLYLPASEKPLLEEKESVKTLLKGEEPILLVDDEKLILETTKELLTGLGYHVFVAASGKEAIAAYRENAKHIRMVILDMIMPDLGGGAVYDRLKEINPEVKVLLSSGYGLRGEAQEILDRGCTDFIQKPFNLIQMSQKIRQILDQNETPE